MVKMLKPRVGNTKPRVEVSSPPAPSDAYRHLYTNSRWRRKRAEFLNHNRLCRICEGRGELTLARVVDHIRPHRGDRRLFWDASNWQPLCKPCHDNVKRREEGREQSSGITG